MMQNKRQIFPNPSQQRLYNSWADSIDNLTLPELSTMRDKLFSDSTYNDTTHPDHQAMLFITPYLISQEMKLRGQDPDGSGSIENQKSNLAQFKQNLNEGIAQPAKGLTVDEQLISITEKETELQLQADEETKTRIEQEEKNKIQEKTWADEKTAQVEQQRKLFISANMRGLTEGTKEHSQHLKTIESRWEKHRLL